MTTSANVIEYTIYNINNVEKPVGRFSKHILCKYPDYAELLKYQPLNEHTIQAWGYDEEEDEWEDEPENLEDFLKPMIPTNKKIRAYFKGEKTVEQIMQEFEEERKEKIRKMHEHFAEQKRKILEELKNKKL
jgi:hypothetical protein